MSEMEVFAKVLYGKSMRGEAGFARWLRGGNVWFGRYGGEVSCSQVNGLEMS